MLLQSTILATALVSGLIGLIGGILGIIAYMRSQNTKDFWEYLNWLKKNGMMK